ncbi:MAG: winged helix-turn-helix transcriptional regulator [Chthonomonadaceae bacterium]|nr:winged helix-turn-helix transcriptional regulator [Chthonomonadaceae bacterium]
MQIGAKVAAIYELQSAWLEPRLRAIEVSWTTFQLFSAIQAAGGKSSQVAVARRLGVTPATLSETVFAHVQNGLMLQVPSTKDRRVKVLELTETGKAQFRNIKKLVLASEKAIGSSLEEKDAQRLEELLDRIIASMEEKDADG